jgi:glyoxylase-like metal-dependent hydrolase (beta-lactamase superfamily II)
MNTRNFGPGISLKEVTLPIPGREGTLGVYLIQAPKIALIDLGPASSLPSLLTALNDLSIKPQDVDFILSTHIHLDHLGGLSQALRLMPRAQVVVHPKGIRHLLDPVRLWEGSCEMLGEIALDYGKPDPVDEDRLLPAEDGMIIDLGNLSMEVFLTPGHAPHHLSYLIRSGGILFPGEAAGVYFPDTGVTRPASPPPFDLRKSLASVQKMIDARPAEIFYSHFGSSPDALTRLRHYREQLLFWGRTVARCLGEDPLQIADLVITLDKTKEQLYRSSPERLKTELYFIHNNIRGYLDYFAREGTGVLLEEGNGQAAGS